mgnify:CR=1 FL=1
MLDFKHLYIVQKHDIKVRDIINCSSRHSSLPNIANAIFFLIIFLLRKWIFFAKNLLKKIWLSSDVLVEMSGLEPPTPTLSEKCMFFCGFIRTPLNTPKTKTFWHIKKSFDVKQNCTLDISWHQMCTFY